MARLNFTDCRGFRYGTTSMTSTKQMLLTHESKSNSNG